MNKIFKESANTSVVISTVIFMLIPYSFFEKIQLCSNFSNEINNILINFLLVLIIFILSILFYTILSHIRKSTFIKGRNYCIEIRYGNLFDIENCKKIIPFDECFTTDVGELPADINPTSICGQYLQKIDTLDIQCLINQSGLKPNRKKSNYQNQVSYESGRLIPNGEYLLMSFSKLNKDGLGTLSRDEFTNSLAVLWEEIDKYYGEKDVCIPILGSGVTRIDDATLTQQELLDIIIMSYKLSRFKVKSPRKLFIICRKQDDFSLEKIGESI